VAVTGTEMLGGRYLLAEVLGAGGMATVWRARDEVLGRDVAVKVLSPQYAADPGFLARFEREARHAAAVSHPRLVTVFDSGIDRGTTFLVMELVTGRTLRQVLDEAGPLPAGQAVAVAAAVCEGLEAAHAARLVHRDVKPANIMLAGPPAQRDGRICAALQRAKTTPRPPAPATPARPSHSRSFPGTSKAPARLRRPPQRIRASCLKAQVTACGTIWYPTGRRRDHRGAGAGLDGGARARPRRLAG